MYLHAFGEQQYFPIVYTLESPFPDGCVLYEVRMTYLNATNYGVGNVCSDMLYCGGPYATMDEHCWAIWQDWAHHYVYNYHNQVYYAPQAFDYSPHVYQFELAGNYCAAYMDGNLLGGAYTNRRPTYVMFGNNAVVSGGPEVWSSIKVDYVRIWLTEPTATEPTTWSRIKAQYQ